MTIIPLLLATLQIGGEMSAEQIRFNYCMSLIDENIQGARNEASRWIMEGGSQYAQQCMGNIQAAGGYWNAAEAAFLLAAQQASDMKDDRAARLYVQAGNAALAAGRPDDALAHFDAALELDSLAGVELGELRLDRASALVTRGDAEAARTEFDMAQALAPEEPLAWLLSATLARRQGDLERAQADIEIAAKLDPRNAATALEAGNIAAMAGDYTVARRNWEQAMAIDPKAPQADAARAQIAQLDAYEREDGTEQSKMGTDPGT
ncbi:MAG: tetratricopeptide repeat protein [Blastomonas sp.]